MINLNTFQKRIINFYLLPILIFSFILTIFINYNFMKFFRNDVEFNNKIETIKEIQRKNIILNGVELKKWTTLTDSQKDFFLKEENKEKLEDKEKFKIKYKIEVIKDYINDDNIDEQYNFFIFIKTMFQSFFFSIFSIILLFSIPRFSFYKFYKDYYLTKLKPFEKFYNLRFYMSNLNSSNNIQSDNKLENIKNMDKFLKYDEKEKEYLFKTNSILQRNLYLNNKKEIEKYLDMENVKIVQDDLIIKISEKTIPKYIEFNENNYKKGNFFLGKTEKDKDVIFDIDGIKHTILIGESGSGKSVNVQNMLLSIFKNLDRYEKIFLVDFKLVEMVRYKNTNKKIEVVSKMEDFFELTETLLNLMLERYSIMEKLKLPNFFGKNMLVFIDEFRTIKNNDLTKEQNEKMIKNLNKLLQQSRRRKIFIIFRGQKRDTENISSSVLSNIMTRITMKTTSNDNLVKIRGTQEELEEYELSHSEIRNFNRGRMFFKDGETGEKFLVQCPFFNVRDEKHSYFMYKLLGLSDNEINEQIERMKYINDLIENKLKKELITEEEFKKLVEEYDLKKMNELNNVLTNDNNDIEKIEKNDEIFASFEEEKTEKIEVLTDNNLNDLEEIRLKKWKETNDLQDKTEQSKKRKILYKVKKLIENNEVEERKNILNTL
jgi:ABC-type dipeptide/oligopeptide/nickel transport system ATPase component